MKYNSEIVEGIYEGSHESNFLWKSVIQKLTLRQAYVFYYSLAYYEKNKIAMGLGILDLPDKTMVHKCLMDALLKENNPREVTQVIGNNAHKILINDNDLIWIKAELRAALWLGYHFTSNHKSQNKLLLDLLRSTSEVEFINRLIHVIDIYGCSLRGDTASTIRIMFDKGQMDLFVDHKVSFNRHRGNYVTNRISDHKLNWLNKMPEDEIDIIIERFKEEKILVLDGIFVPITRRDKRELIKASLDIQNYTYIANENGKSLISFVCQYPARIYKPTEISNEAESAQKNKRSKKNFTSLSADEIIDLLKKAHNSRKYRKVASKTKIDSGLTLKKESNTILIALSEQLGATPKKIVESLIQGVNLADESELLKIDANISGRRTSRKSSAIEHSIEQKMHIEMKELVELKETSKVKDTKEVNTAVKKQSSNRANMRKNNVSDWNVKREQLISKRSTKKRKFR